MTKIIYRLSLLLALSILFATCKKSTTSDVSSQNEINLSTFRVATSEVGVYNVGLPIENVDNATQQIYQSEGGKSLRVVSDEGDLCFRLTLSSPPSMVGESVEVSYTTTKDVATQYSTTVVKLDGGYVWLWSAESQRGFVLLSW